MAEFRLSNFTSGVALTAAELNTGLTFADYTPDWTQSATITKTVNWARYTKFGKLVIGTIKMTATSGGTANNVMKVSLPVSASSNNFMMGTFSFINGGNSFRGFALFDSATTLSFWLTNTSSSAAINESLRFGQTGMGDRTIVSTDIIYVQFQYEAA